MNYEKSTVLFKSVTFSHLPRTRHREVDLSIWASGTQRSTVRAWRADERHHSPKGGLYRQSLPWPAVIPTPSFQWGQCALKQACSYLVMGICKIKGLLGERCSLHCSANLTDSFFCVDWTLSPHTGSAHLTNEWYLQRNAKKRLMSILIMWWMLLLYPWVSKTTQPCICRQSVIIKK